MTCCDFCGEHYTLCKCEQQSRPYKIAEIAYDPQRIDSPWYVIRTGTVAEQGGLAFGNESSYFQTIEDACTYLSEIIDRDMDVIKDAIKRKEGWS